MTDYLKTTTRSERQAYHDMAWRTHILGCSACNAGECDAVTCETCGGPLDPNGCVNACHTWPVDLLPIAGASDGGELVRCPDCAGLNRVVGCVRFACRACGRVAQTADCRLAPIAGGSDAPDGEALYCEECGWEIAPEGVYLPDPGRLADARPARCSDTACVARATSTSRPIAGGSDAPDPADPARCRDWPHELEERGTRCRNCGADLSTSAPRPVEPAWSAQTFREAAHAGTLPRAWPGHAQNHADPERVGVLFKVSPILPHDERRWSCWLTESQRDGWPTWIEVPASVVAAVAPIAGGSDAGCPECGDPTPLPECWQRCLACARAPKDPEEVLATCSECGEPIRRRDQTVGYGFGVHAACVSRGYVDEAGDPARVNPYWRG